MNNNLLAAIRDQDYHAFKPAFREVLDKALQGVKDNLASEPINIDESDEEEGKDPDSADPDRENYAIDEIEETASDLNGTDFEYEDGVWSGSFNSKQNVVSFTEWLDGFEDVDAYDIDIIDDEGETETEIDLDTLEDTNNNAIFIVTVYLNPDIVWYDQAEEIDEVTRKIKVNSRGQKRIKMKCGKGFKWDPNGRNCKKIVGDELYTLRKSVRKARITKKTKGISLKRITIRKAKKAKRFRKMLGLDKKK